MHPPNWGINVLNLKKPHLHNLVIYFKYIVLLRLNNFLHKKKHVSQTLKWGIKKNGNVPQNAVSERADFRSQVLWLGNHEIFILHLFHNLKLYSPIKFFMNVRVVRICGGLLAISFVA